MDDIPLQMNRCIRKMECSEYPTVQVVETRRYIGAHLQPRGACKHRLLEDNDDHYINVRRKRGARDVERS